MADPSLAQQLSHHFLATPSPPLYAQLSHRLSLVSFFSIPAGSLVLELGCGQGDTTLALAHAVGPHGHIDAVDPGSPDYGTPPLKDAQSHILSSPLGSRITFHRATATQYVEKYQGEAYDYVVLAHSLWYFEHPGVFEDLVGALKTMMEKGKGKTKLCIAEWSLSASSLAGVPHVLTALLRALLEAKRPEPSGANIRTVLSPAQIKRVVSDGLEIVGVKLLKEEIKELGESEEGMLDAYWEVGYTLRRREKDMARLEETGVSIAERTQVEAYFDSLEMATEAVGGVEGVRCMSVWAGVFG